MLAKPNEFGALLKNAEQALASAAKWQTRAMAAAENICADDNAFVMDISSSPIACAVACRAAFLSSLDAVAAAELSNDAVKELHENRKKYRAAAFCPHHRQCRRDGQTQTCSNRQQCHIGSCPSAPRRSKCGKDYYKFSCGCRFNDQSLRLAYESVERCVSRIPPASVHTFRSHYPEYAGFEHMFAQHFCWSVSASLPKAGGVIKPHQHCERDFSMLKKLPAFRGRYVKSRRELFGWLTVRVRLPRVCLERVLSYWVDWDWAEPDWQAQWEFMALKRRDSWDRRYSSAFCMYLHEDRSSLRLFGCACIYHAEDPAPEK